MTKRQGAPIHRATTAQHGRDSARTVLRRWTGGRERASTGTVRWRAVTLDFGGTLDAPGEHWIDRFRAHYARAGLAVEPSRLRSAFDAATRKAYDTPALARVNLRDLVEFHLREQWKFLGWTWNGLAEQIREWFVTESLANLQHSRRVLESLRGTVRLGVISNFYGNLERVLAEANMLELFDAVLDSAVVGLRKPDARLFLLAAERLACEPWSIVHVGDSLEQDVFAARRAGLQSAWLCAAQDPAVPRDLEPEWILRSLEELEALLEGRERTSSLSDRSACKVSRG